MGIKKPKLIMKTIFTYFAAFLISFTYQQLQAQEKTNTEKITFLEQQREKLISEEKEALKKKVESINFQLENKEISQEQAEELKIEAAKLHAQNIKNRIAIIENQMALLERNAKDTSTSYVALFNNGKVLDVSIDNENRKDKYEKRTTNDIVLAFGFNNALQDGQALDDSDFKIAGSRFFEIGWAWRTRVFEKTDWLRFKYGLSFQFNGLKPTENRYLVEDGELTVLEEFPMELDKSKFRMDNLVVPIHFEFGPYTKQESKSGVRFYTHDKIKIGLGGYAGLNIGERQKLKYEEDGEKVKEKLQGSYNTNDVIYGLSGYIGWGGAGLYVKYDLNPIFEAPNPELHNFSVGLRFDVD